MWQKKSKDPCVKTVPPSARGVQKACQVPGLPSVALFLLSIKEGVSRAGVTSLHLHVNLKSTSEDGTAPQARPPRVAARQILGESESKQLCRGEQGMHGCSMTSV
jgi:hypothetical protein